MAEQALLIRDADLRPAGGSQALMTMIERAVLDPAFDVAKMQALFELKRQYEADEARKAFAAAKADFKAKSIRIVKDKDNLQYKSKYVSLGNLVNTVTPFLSDCGLESSWEIDQTSGIKVSCKLTHSMGHSESVSMVVPADSSGAKNPIQQIKSAITYAKACTFESVCGLASTDTNLDDDGNGFSNGELAEKIEWIENARNPDELKRMYEQAYKLAKEAGSTNAMKAIIAAKDKRKAELS